MTKDGKVTAMLHALTDEDLEDYLFENDPRFMAIIEARREQYRREGGIPLEQLAKELGIGWTTNDNAIRVRVMKREPKMSASKIEAKVIHYAQRYSTYH